MIDKGYKSLNVRHRFKIGAWLIAALLALATGHLNLWLIVFGSYLSYLVFGPMLSHRIFSSKVMKIVTSAILYTLILQCVIVSAWLISPDTPLHLAPLFGALLMIVVLALTHKRRRDKINNTSAVNRYDIVAALLSLAIVILLVVPSIYRVGGGYVGFVQVINSGVDDAAHLSLVNDHIAVDRGIRTNVNVDQTLRNYTMYPAGWHSLNALVITAVHPNISTGHESLIAYAISKVFWFAILIYLVFRVGMQLLAIIVRRSQLSIVECVVFALIAAWFLQVFAHSFIDGFYNFIPQIACGILIVALIAQISYKAKSDDKQSFEGTFLLLSITAIAGSLVWVLPLPALTLFLMSILAIYAWTLGWKQALRSFASKSLPFIPLYILIVAAILTQSYVLSIDASPGAVDFLKSLLASGGVVIFNPIFYLVVGAGLALFIWAARRERKYVQEVAQSYGLLLISVLVFMSFVYIYQQINLDSNAYYYYKLLYLATSMTIPFAVVGYAYAICRISSSNLSKLLAGVFAVCLLINLVGIEPTTTKYHPHTFLSYIQGLRVTPFFYNHIIYDHIHNLATINHYDDKKYFLFYDPDRPGFNDAANVLLRVNKPMTTCSESLRKTFLNNDKPKKSDSLALEACEGYNIYLIADYSDIKKLERSDFKKFKIINHRQAGGSEPLPM